MKNCSSIKVFQLIIMLLLFLHADADTDSNASVYAVILVPLVFAGLAVLTLFCCRKYVKSLSFCLAPD